MKRVLLMTALFYLCHINWALKFICHKCAKAHGNVAFDNEDEFIKHSEWHMQEDQNTRDELIKQAERDQEADDNRPKLFHCHRCQFMQSFNSSSEFVAHIEKEHNPTTVEECTDFLPQGKLRLKGHKDIPPELSALNAAYQPNVGGFGPGGFGGGGMGGGGFGGGNADYNGR